jgi:hypothetical protein
MNISLRSVVCGLAALALAGSAAADVVINEVYYDGPGTTDMGMFTELKGTPGMSLQGYVLAGVNGANGDVYATIDLSAATIPGDGYFVVGDEFFADPDLMNPDADWQNGPDQVLLWVIAGEAQQDTTLVDSVCYGASAFLTCEGTNAEDVAAGNSLARCPDGFDSDDNSADFVADPTPTPGVENDAICEPPITDYTLCELAEVDDNNFPIHFGEFVRVTDIVALVSTGVFRAPGTGMDIYAYQPSTGCCISLFDFNYLGTVNEGDFITELIGTLDFFNGQTEITAIQTLTISGTVGLPAPIEVTTGVLSASDDAYDNCLISICGARLTGGGDPWPPDGLNANVEIDDGSGPTIVRVDLDTDIDGSPAPVEPFTVLGIATQFDSSSPYDSGYQIKPRRRTDIADGVDCPTPVQPRSWGQIKNQYR